MDLSWQALSGIGIAVVMFVTALIHHLNRTKREAQATEAPFRTPSVGDSGAVSFGAKRSR
jgi:hypothetical protein